MAVKHGLLPVQLKEGSGILKTEFGRQFVDQFCDTENAKWLLNTRTIKKNKNFFSFESFLKICIVRNLYILIFILLAPFLEIRGPSPFRLRDTTTCRQLNPFWFSWFAQK